MTNYKHELELIHKHCLEQIELKGEPSSKAYLEISRMIDDVFFWEGVLAKGEFVELNTKLPKEEQEYADRASKGVKPFAEMINRIFNKNAPPEPIPMPKFYSRDELVRFITGRLPMAVKPSRPCKSKFVPVFTSANAQDQVIEVLADYFIKGFK